MIKKMIPAATAKDQLAKIDKLLKETHILIGGLAVQQYHPTRTSKDIDLICDDATAKGLIDRLYPTKDYDISETNEDDFRPAYVISSRKNEEKVIFIGPKIVEREPYKYIDWEKLKRDAKNFKYKNKVLKNIKVPCVETLAFTKLLSFLNRVQNDKGKGENDLLDFINLSNKTDFRINVLIDLIRSEECENFIKSRLVSVKSYYDAGIWEKSLLSDYFDIVGPAISIDLNGDDRAEESNSFKKVYSTENSIDFYDEIALNYDQRNTRFLYQGHQAVISKIIKLLPEGGSIIDFGCGTGRLIAAHFIHHSNIRWVAIDGSKNMLEQFKSHTKSSTMSVELLHSSITDLAWNDLKESDLCMVCFTLSSLPSVEYIGHIANKVKKGGALLVADIHPSTTFKSPYYDFDLTDRELGVVALTPQPVFPDKILEILYSKDFLLESHSSISHGSGEEYAFISVYRSQN